MQGESTGIEADAQSASEAQGRARWRNAGLLLIAIFVASCGLFALWGSQTTTSGSEGAFVFSVEHPRVLLAGTPAPLSLRVSGLNSAEEFEVTLCPALWERLDFQNWYPNPDAEAATDQGPSYTFTTNGPEAVIRLDARSQPNQGPALINCSVTAATESSRVELAFRVLTLP